MSKQYFHLNNTTKFFIKWFAYSTSQQRICLVPLNVVTSDSHIETKRVNAALKYVLTTYTKSNWSDCSLLQINISLLMPREDLPTLILFHNHLRKYIFLMEPST